MAGVRASRRQALCFARQEYCETVVFESVSLAFGNKEVLRQVSFSLPAKRLMILLGASGSGKSVLLKLILGLLKPDSGVIRVNGERIDDMSE